MRRTIGLSDSFPKIICLCGSTRFTEQMLVKQWELSKQGYVVLSWCALPDSYYKATSTQWCSQHGYPLPCDKCGLQPTIDRTHVGDREGVKEIVDEVHKRKIDLADSLFVINLNGYVGESTASEIRYAMGRGMCIEWLEPHKVPETFR